MPPQIVWLLGLLSLFLSIVVMYVALPHDLPWGAFRGLVGMVLGIVTMHLVRRQAWRRRL